MYLRFQWIFLLSRMAYSDFVRTFSQLEVIHLDGETSRDEPSLRMKTPWTSRVYQGAWQRGVTAGGCRNNPGELSSSVIVGCC